MSTIEQADKAPNLENAAAKFKSELKKLSHNALCRQACDFYMRLIASYARIEALELELSKIKESK